MLAALCGVGLGTARPTFAQAPRPIDFNRDIRPILSNNCFQCHGPDENKRQAKLRLDTEEGAVSSVIVRGKPDQSALVYRITTEDADEHMPPAATGKKLSAAEVRLLTQWVRQGAPYARHWSYVKPVRPELPAVNDKSWPKNAVDHFILARLQREGLRPSPEADRAALVRRVSLDLVGLPPTLEEVEQFVGDRDPRAYENLIDRVLKKDAYGEHWARMWLDLARYADSAGYADDPARTIWAYRDYVIRSFNQNKPFDQFTLEQIAGDLLPKPAQERTAQEQLIATAFHRNTLTNNEGGTSDEEFRNVAVVDRVNTTLAVWMGTTITCCQCHHHKYDPISQEDFFRLFAFFNNTADADRPDESPTHQLWSQEQERQKAALSAEITGLEKSLSVASRELAAAQAKWQQRFAAEPRWQTLRPAAVKLQSGGEAKIAADGAVFVPSGAKTDTYTLELPLPQAEKGLLTAIQLQTLPHDSLPSKGAGHGGGNFVITSIKASLTAPSGQSPAGRFVRIELPGQGKMLSLAEVQVLRGTENIARAGEAKQSSTDYDGPARLAIDGNTNGDYFAAKSTTHSAAESNPWWEVDLKKPQTIERIAIWNRTDNGLHVRLANFRVAVLNEQRKAVWEQVVTQPPNPSAEFSLGGARSVSFAAAYADFSQSGFEPTSVIDVKDAKRPGWAVGPQVAVPHYLTLIAQSPVEVAVGSKLTVTIEQLSPHASHTLGHFRLAVTSDASIGEYAKTPPAILALLKTPEAKRSDAQRAELTKHFLSIAPELQPRRENLASLKKQLADMKPLTTVPVMQELAGPQRRTTKLQHRGNFLDLGKTVTEGVPAAFHPLPQGQPLNRLTLARWLVDENNPLTARVIVNRYWEAIYGIGLVRTSEEFGSQGELPSHPELLDWLATELVRSKWDLKHVLKLLVTAAAYRQSSRVTPELIERDPENRLLARGPRFRLSAEMVRDQALAVSGLLSDKMYGPPVKPPQPALGVSAAFGSGIDWQTSQGEDQHRRGLYTTWRRSNPYPSMAAFDAPNREVCTIRRDRTNTPLQALVTLNDPVYIEAAQALARRIAKAPGASADKARYGFRLCLARQPSDKELSALLALFDKSYDQFSQDREKAARMATKPLGKAPDGANIAELAAWTVVANVLLNLDEMFMKR
jgi:hypothetical protein